MKNKISCKSRLGRHAETPKSVMLNLFQHPVCPSRETLKPILQTPDYNLPGRGQAEKAAVQGDVQGFTLIELLVVVLIIGILAGIALPQYQRAVLKSRYVQLQVLSKSFAEAQRRYYQANGDWADRFEDLDLDMPSGTVVSGAFARLGNYSWMIWINATRTVGTVGGTLGKIQYLHEFSGDRQCRAKEGATMELELCKSYGGSKLGVYDGWEAYRIP